MEETIWAKMDRVGRLRWKQWHPNLGGARPNFHASLSLPVDRPQFWLLVAVMAVGTILHYGELLPLLSTAAAHSPVSLATRQGLERVLFLLPVLYATVVFRTRGGVIALLVAGSVMLPQAIRSSTNLDHAVPEMGGVMAVGALLVLAITGLRGEIETQQQMRESLDFYTRQVLSAQENERKRIALELHDGPTQSLLLICQHLDRLGTSYRQWPAAEIVSRMQEVRGIAVQTLTDLRRLTQDLRPRILDDLGLPAALEWLADTIASQYGFKAYAEMDGALPALSSEAEMLLFRIAQEALHNAGQHAAATEARVSLSSNGNSAKMTVADNGQGFQLPKRVGDLANTGKMGLLGMYERAQLLSGTLRIHSELGKGTQVMVDLPLNCVNLAPAADQPSQ